MPRLRGSTENVQAVDALPEGGLSERHLQLEGENCFEPITFSEFNINTPIETQYESKGIHFGGDFPFITMDVAQPTSPVLSGQPLFQGRIQGTFVDPATGNPTVVPAFSFVAGYFDNFGSTRLSWYDRDGNAIGQKINSVLGFENLVVDDGGSIASFDIEIFQDEPAGFAIDDFVSCQTQASILFREKSGDSKESTWGRKEDGIPGFDHTAFNYLGDVYESHPGYAAGNYVSADNIESVSVKDKEGVQQQFTVATFSHDARAGTTSRVVDFAQVPINKVDADAIKEVIEGIMATRSTFRFLDNRGLKPLLKSLNPYAQKGGGENSFTCVGLVEHAAEKAGINYGAGFIPNSLEAIRVGDQIYPLLSPQLLYIIMSARSLIAKGGNILNKAMNTIKGWFDLVDYLLRDPLGRRLGIIAGVEFNEIPLAFKSGDGGLEFFVIFNRVPGPYTLTLHGVKGKTGLGVVEITGANKIGGLVIGSVKGAGDRYQARLRAETFRGCTGDLNNDGLVDGTDRAILLSRLGVFTNGRDDPGDLNGDGILDSTDVDLFDRLVVALGATPSPTDQVTPAQCLKRISTSCKCIMLKKGSKCWMRAVNSKCSPPKNKAKSLRYLRTVSRLYRKYCEK